jgi:hypothetical protein
MWNFRSTNGNGMSPFRKNKKFQATKRLFNEDAVPLKCRYYYISFDLMIHISAYFFFYKKTAAA